MQIKQSFILNIKIMSVDLITGIVFLVISLINFIIWILTGFDEIVLDILAICLGIFLIFGSAGLIETLQDLNVAKPGYIINIDNKRNIEVVQRKKNYIQFIDNGDTLVVSKSVWINQILRDAKVVNIKGF